MSTVSEELGQGLRVVESRRAGKRGVDPLRILFVQHCANRTGSTISGLVAVEGFRRAGWEVDAVFGFDGPMMAEYAALGCRTHVVPHKNWLRGGNVIQSARRIMAELSNSAALRQLIDEAEADCVYVNSLVSLCAAAASWRSGVPCVWHIREMFEDAGGEMCVPACGERWLVRRLLSGLATRRVALSRIAADNILGEGALVDIVPNAAGDVFFEAVASRADCCARFGLPPDVPIVGVPGTLRPVKGHPYFLKAAARVLQTMPECVFAITGTGEPAYERDLHDQARSLGIEQQLRFLGTVSDMPRFYRSCDLICVPSQSESFGRTVIESFAVGPPVVATAVGGMREIIENGRTGVLVEYGDVEGFSAAVVSLLSDAGRAGAMSAAAREVAWERYSSGPHQERLCGIVESVVRSNSR